MKDTEEFCGELDRHSGRDDSGLSVRGLVIAAAAGWTVRAVLVAAVAIAGGCAHTSISRGDDCGEFSSTVVGVPPFYTPAGQYATYASACGAERFSRIVANQRVAIVAGAQAAAAGGGRDVVARRHIAEAQRDVLALQGDVDVIVGRIDGESEGGVR
ncbi:MAG: hypothetical protein Q8R16_00505 [bacterium]|nr:hypothetical protein [bacterium]